MPSPFPLLLNFPDEILIRVRQSLTHHSDSMSWRLVCKDFHRVDLISRKALRVRRIEFLLSLIAKFENIDELDLSVCSRINDGTVSIFVGFASSSLRRLILRRSAGLSYIGLEKVTSHCTGLEMVDMSYSWRFGDREAAAVSNCEGLKEVRLDKCLGVTDVGLARIVVGCGRLERLSLKWCLQVSAAEAGLQMGTRIVSFGTITTGDLRAVAALLQSSVGSPVEVTVLGAGPEGEVALQVLRLVPRPLAAGGLLGCVLEVI